MSSIKNVTIVGASGSLGSIVFDKFRAHGKFNIRVLRRPTSKATFPEGTDVVDVDTTSLEALTAALKGQDAVVSIVGLTELSNQKVLIDAAAAAGVKRILPSEYGSNVDNPNSRKLPVFQPKVEIQEYLFDTVRKTPSLTYTLVYNGAFLDWGLEHGMTLAWKEYKPTLYDGGDSLFSTTTLPTVADAIIGILEHPEETRNRPVYIQDTQTTQNKLLELAKKAAPGKTWEPKTVKLTDIVAVANERLAKGLLDFETFAPYLAQSIYGPDNGGRFDKTDNELLGLKPFGDEQLEAVVNKYVH